ncbi:MAG: AzlD domain-containing protein [Desulfofustis sp. PB-SRB1]|nr:AzlD domain-containing protein [Desulfofustis sp. PB-SRB1]MBM1003209.1 AzlD domain-containing protein [Desulfofustis sp. PB-SRB1]
MALATYLTRISGPFLVGFVQGNERLENCLAKLPGSILAALLAPLVFMSGTAEIVGAVGTLIVVYFTKNMPLSLIAGVGTVAMLRLFWGL